MAQEGSYVKRNGWWLLRYRESVFEKGNRKRVLRARKIASLAEFPPKRQRRNAGNIDVSHAKFDDVPDVVADCARLPRFSERQPAPAGTSPQDGRVRGVGISTVGTGTAQAVNA